MEKTRLASVELMKRLRCIDDRKTDGVHKSRKYDLPEFRQKPESAAAAENRKMGCGGSKSDTETAVEELQVLVQPKNVFIHKKLCTLFH